jgi:hypothetical protein
MTNSTTVITTADEIGAALDELSHALCDVPGRRPGDAQRARTLLSLTVTLISGNPPSQFLLDTLRAYGADVGEVQTIARALSGTALRLGAWLGRNNYT